MCRGEPNLAEAQLALQQLQALADHLQQSTRQWRSHLEDAGQVAARLQFQKALHHAGKLRQALHQAEHALAEQGAAGGSEITVTPLLPPSRNANTPASHDE